MKPSPYKHDPEFCFSQDQQARQRRHRAALEAARAARPADHELFQELAVAASKHAQAFPHLTSVRLSFLAGKHAPEIAGPKASARKTAERLFRKDAR